MLAGGETKGVGGFSLICGKLRKEKKDGVLAPLAIVCNRNDDPDRVPWICGGRGETVGLSNTSYVDRNCAEADTSSEPRWPKIRDGERMLEEAVQRAVAENLPEEKFVESLFAILDDDKLPLTPGMGFEETIALLKESIYIPPLGDEEHRVEMDAARQGRPSCNATAGAAAADNAGATAGSVGTDGAVREAAEVPRGEEKPGEQLTGFMSGLYGTQRQTVLLVDWNGKVTYIERPLWDSYGDAVPRGKADEVFTFDIDGWESP
jgi:uncharacterized protein with NRDE domain